jgi:endonuclease/exonuclease/phosphatase family metal-dependent hydrolase
MALLVRSWNLFHGNTHPPDRKSHLREMIELVVADDPDVVCLQEIPVWALARLGAWSGMRSFPAIARRGLRPADAAGWITRLDNGLLRSAITGQANAILVAERHAATDLGAGRISDRGRERRICQAARVAELVVANLHASAATSRPEIGTVELERARAFAESRAEASSPVVVAGDFNLPGHGLDGYSAPGSGIDQVLVRGATSSPVGAWPLERRVQNGRVLSDHAPVEARIG